MSNPFEIPDIDWTTTFERLKDLQAKDGELSDSELDELEAIQFFIDELDDNLDLNLPIHYSSRLH